MAAPFIGSRISLVSKSEIRYEGTLHTIDTKESTVALKNVRSFDTEGRRFSLRVSTGYSVIRATASARPGTLARISS